MNNGIARFTKVSLNVAEERGAILAGTLIGSDPSTDRDHHEGEGNPKTSPRAGAHFHTGGHWVLDGGNFGTLYHVW